MSVRKLVADHLRYVDQERRERTPPIVNPIANVTAVIVAMGLWLGQPAVALLGSIGGATAVFVVLIKSERARRKT